jgi:hypothetical protein
MLLQDLFNRCAPRDLSKPEYSVVATVGLAVTIDCLVGVVGLSCLAVVLYVAKGPGGIPSIASVIIVRALSSAVYYLLLTEVDGDVGPVELDLMALVGGGGSKGPARPAGSLVPDCSDNIFGPPVDGLGESGIHWFLYEADGLCSG